MKKILSLFAAFSLLCLSGCSVSVESLLSPPKLDEEQSAIYEALRLSKGGDVHLKYPVSGQYRSAFVVENIDSEETDEAIVFYEASNVTDGGSSLRLNFLDKQDGEWVSVYDFAALGSEIERVRFTDLGDGGTSIMVTYSILNSSDSATSIFRYADNTPQEVYKSRHSYLNLLDINEDGAEEVFLINQDRTAGTASAYLLGWAEGDIFTVLSAAPLNEHFSECRNIVSGPSDDLGYKGIFIDYTRTDGSLGTDILICSDRTFMPSKAIPEQLIHRTNTYTPSVYSQDIDGDGIIEIPATSPFPGYENHVRSEQVNITHWYQLASAGYSIKQDFVSYMSIRGDYMLLIPSRWVGSVTITVSIADGTAAFSRYDSTTKEIVEELMVIRALPEASVERADLTGFTEMGRSEKTNYCFFIKNNTESSFALTEAELKDYFRILG